LKQGQHALWTGRSAEAKSKLDSVQKELAAQIKLSPLSPQLKSETALFWWIKGNNSNVTQHAQAAITGAPRNMLALHLRALSELKTGNPATAKWILTQLSTRHPTSATIHNSLGAALAQLGDGQNALTHFKRAIALQPNNLDVRMNLALLHLKFLNYSQADSELSRVLTKLPGHLSAKSMQSSMRKITPSKD